jgi:hypothetical protein
MSQIGQSLGPRDTDLAYPVVSCVPQLIVGKSPTLKRLNSIDLSLPMWRFRRFPVVLGLLEAASLMRRPALPVSASTHCPLLD